MYKIWALILTVLIISSCESDIGETSIYHLETVKLSDGSSIMVKYNEVSGETSYYSDEKWIEIKESDRIKASKYEVRGKSHNNGGWIAIRLDKKSGKSWFGNGNNWQEIK